MRVVFIFDQLKEEETKDCFCGSVHIAIDEMHHDNSVRRFFFELTQKSFLLDEVGTEFVFYSVFNSMNIVDMKLLDTIFQPFFDSILLNVREVRVQNKQKNFIDDVVEVRDTFQGERVKNSFLLALDRVNEVLTLDTIFI